MKIPAKPTSMLRVDVSNASVNENVVIHNSNCPDDVNTLSVEENGTNVLPQVTTKTRIKRIVTIQLDKLQHDYKYFSENGIDIRKYTIPELKIIARYNKISVSGTKSILADRIEHVFSRSKYVSKIQRVFKGFLVRMSVLLRGHGLMDRKLCTNITDFYTMDPLCEIPFYDFFSYTDRQNFTYGFSIKSLIELLRKKGRLVNPYNREKFSNETTFVFMKLLRIDDALYKHIFINQAQDTVPTVPTNHRNVPNVPNVPNPPNPINIYSHLNIPNILNTHVNVPLNNINQPIITQPINPQMIQNIATTTASSANTINSAHVSLVRNQIAEIRQKPLNQRMIDAFMEIDQLGNYTNSIWFSQLSAVEYINFYVSLIDIWRFRAHLTSVVRYQISPLQDPFFGLLPARISYNQISLEQIQMACISAIEILVYTGLDIEQRKLGAIYVLSALTVVSREARNTMPWLYEAFY